MVPYNMTAITGTGNDTGLLQITQGVNDVLLNGMLGAIFLGGLGIIILSSFYFNSRDWGSSILATSFITFVLSLSLVALHLLSDFALIFTGIILILSVIFVWAR